MGYSFPWVKTHPVDYEYNSKAWMLSGVWEWFLKRWNTKLAIGSRHVLLLADNAPCHSKIPLSNIKLVLSSYPPIRRA